jgi:hypothetical protein
MAMKLASLELPVSNFEYPITVNLLAVGSMWFSNFYIKAKQTIRNASMLCALGSPKIEDN